MARKKKIDRRLSPSDTTAATDAGSAQQAVESRLVVQLHDEYGRPGPRWDFSSLGLPPDVAEAFATAFRQKMGAQALSTARSCWKNFGWFARFVRENDDICSLATISTACINRYIHWLSRQTTQTGHAHRPGTKHNRYMTLKGLVEWIQRNQPGTLPSDIRLPSNPYPRKNASAEKPEPLADATIEAIGRACRGEIDRAIADFEWGQAVLARKPAVLPPLDGSLEVLVWHLASIGDGSVCPDFRTCERNGISYHARHRHGGLERLARYFHVTATTLTAFYIEIVRQTDANAEGMRHIARDCLGASPLHPAHTVVTWTKKRGGQTITPQRRAFPANKSHAAPQLILKLGEMVQPYRHRASPASKDRLFLVPPLGSSTVNVVSENVVNRRCAALAERHRLPYFTYRQLRRAGGIRVHRTTGDIRQAQQALGHASAQTTHGYVAGAEADARNRQTIQAQQAAMLRWIEPDAGDADPTASAGAGVAETPFGFGCSGPLDGVGYGSKPGEVCPQFLKCLTCSGAVIVKSVRTLAKLIHTKEHLEDCRDTMQTDRWHGVYYPMYERLLAVIAEFPSGMEAQARDEMASLAPLPTME